MPLPPLRLHDHGPLFSRLALGFWRLAEAGLSVEERLRLIHTALDEGVTTFDHADIYGGYTCEGLFGEALAREPGLRPQMQLVSKCGIRLVHPARPEHRRKRYDTSRAHILASVDRSLAALRTDHLDLLLIHRPDPFLDVDETAEGLQAVVTSGKVRHVGVSNFSPAQFDLLQSRMFLPLVTNQIEVSPLRITPFLNGTLDHLQRLNTHAMAWSPFAGGRLLTDEAPETTRVRQALTQLGRELGGASVEQTALAWLLAHPARLLPVLGTTRPERLRAAAAAAVLRPDADQWFDVWTAAYGGEVP
jgi:predicted oxidoreductase